MSNLVIAIIVIVILIIIGSGIGVGVYLYQNRATESSSETSETSGTSEMSGKTPAVVNLPASAAVPAPVGTTAATLLAQPPVTSPSGNTSTFVPITPETVPKTKTGEPIKAAPGHVWVAQEIKTSTGKTITVPIVVPTNPPKQNIVTKGLDGKPLGKAPKGMVWVKKTFTKNGKSASVVVLEKKI